MSGGAAAAAAACVFCRIIRGELPAVKVAESARSIAFMDVAPLSDGHCLVVPKEHQQTFPNLSSDSVVDLALLAHKVAKALGDVPFNMLQNNGKAAGQTVMHVHIHLIPKTPKDGLGFRWNAHATPDPAALQSAAKMLAERIAANEAEAEEGGKRQQEVAAEAEGKK